MRPSFRVGLVLSLALSAPLGQANEAGEAPIGWREPKETGISWRGMLPAESGVVAGAPMLYPGVPGAGLGGLLAAILTHGAIVSSAQAAQRKAEQESADKVLDPYRPALDVWTAQGLWERAAADDSVQPRLKLMPEGAAWDGPVVETLPVFSLAPDERALVLDVAVRLAGAAANSATDIAVRVVSSPVEGDARAFWSADESARLKAHAAGMLAHAVRIARHHARAAQDDPPARTYRYTFGSVDRSERGQLVEGNCERTVLRTLRGGLISVPAKAVLGADCQRRMAF